jgi:uncharacterized membrane protein (UPF0127 family)
MRWVSLAALVLAVGCSRTPPEPAPAASTITSEPAKPLGSTPVTSPSASAKPGRCLTPMPAVAPVLPKAASSAECPTDPEGGSKMPTAMVAFPDAPGNMKVDVEIAANEHDVTKGLMYRRQMNEEHGMLFKLGERRDHTFWMHNTCMPLDMLFIDEDGTIVGIVEGAEPLTDSSRSVGCDSTHVLEMNAGWARRHAVKPGQRVGLPAAAR